MKLETIEKFAIKTGFEVRTAKLTSGKTGLFISLEITEYSRAGMVMGCKPVGRDIENKLLKYLARYKIPYKYSGNYTNLLIEGVKV